MAIEFKRADGLTCTIWTAFGTGPTNRSFPATLDDLARVYHALTDEDALAMSRVYSSLRPLNHTRSIDNSLAVELERVEKSLTDLRAEALRAEEREDIAEKRAQGLEEENRLLAARVESDRIMGNEQARREREKREALERLARDVVESAHRFEHWDAVRRLAAFLSPNPANEGFDGWRPPVEKPFVGLKPNPAPEPRDAGGYLARPCGKPCDHGSPCTLPADHDPGDRHEGEHGCIFYDPKPVPPNPATDVSEETR